jgi:hypothetical protein
MFWRAAKVLYNPTKPGQGDLEKHYALLVNKSRERLALARDLYLKASRAARWRPGAELPTVHWVLSQYLALEMALEGRLDWNKWWAANVDADNYRGGAEQGGRTLNQIDELWANSSKAELYLLAFGAKKVIEEGGEREAPAKSDGSPNELATPIKCEDLRAGALDYIRRHVELAHIQSKTDELASTKNHLRFYVDWWYVAPFASQDVVKSREEMLNLANEMMKILDTAG